MPGIKQRAARNNASQRRPAKAALATTPASATKAKKAKQAATRAYGATPPPLVTFEGVVELGYPLRRERVRQLTHEDPRFPRAVFGGTGMGRKGVWSREKVVAYFHLLAEKGPHDAEDERAAAASNAEQREAPLQAAA